MAELSEADFAREGVTYQIGVPPERIDNLTELTGLAFGRALVDLDCITAHRFPS